MLSNFLRDRLEIYVGLGCRSCGNSIDRSTLPPNFHILCEFSPNFHLQDSCSLFRSPLDGSSMKADWLRRQLYCERCDHPKVTMYISHLLPCSVAFLSSIPSSYPSRKVEEEIESIRETSSLEEKGGWLTLLSPDVRPALIVGMMLQAIQQLTGINTAMYYRYFSSTRIYLHSYFTSPSASIIALAGFSDKEAIYLSTLIALANALFTIVSLMLVDSYSFTLVWFSFLRYSRLGRRKLLLWTLPPTTFFMAVLGLSFYIQDNYLLGEVRSYFSFPPSSISLSILMLSPLFSLWNPSLSMLRSLRSVWALFRGQ